MMFNTYFKQYLDNVVQWTDEYEHTDDQLSTQIGRQYLKLEKLMKRQRIMNSFIEGKKPSNSFKNRYIDILPYDRTRVILSKSSQNSDYINASFINDFNGNRRYIATQGPSHLTIVDFFRMIHQYEIDTIVCLANEVEFGRVKFHRYWPRDETPLKFDPFIVTLNKSSNKFFYGSDYTILPLIIKRANHEQEVLLFHYFNWPDNKVPDDEIALLSCYKDLLNHRRLSVSTSPILIHCSAGCGRTGTFIAIDLCRYYIDNLPFSPKNSPVMQITSHIRNYRIALIRTLEQYAFIYKFLILLAKASEHY